MIIGIKIAGAEKEGVKLLVNGKEVQLNGGVYYTDAIHATEFDDEFVFALYDGNKLIQTYTYSVTSYIYAKMNATKDGELTAMANLARALYRYGESAKNYVKSLGN